MNAASTRERLRGVATLVKTPFDEDGRLDEASYRRQVAHVVGAGTVMLIPGMLGSETFSLSAAQRRRCIEICLEEAGGVPVCPAVGAEGVNDTVAGAREAERIGAHAVAVIPPAWIKKESSAVACIESVAAAVDIPVMFHSMYGYGAGIFRTEAMARIVRSHENARYVKVEGTHWVRQAAALHAEIGDLLFGLMSGPNYVMCAQAGCTMFMSAGDLLEVVIAIFHAIECGDLTEARRIDGLYRNIAALKTYFVGELTNKVIMQRRGLFASSRLGSPQMWDGAAALEPREEEELTEALRTLLPFFKIAPPSPPA